MFNLVLFLEGVNIYFVGGTLDNIITLFAIKLFYIILFFYFVLNFEMTVYRKELISVILNGRKSVNVLRND